jgi:hypothetical protein
MSAPSLVGDLAEGVFVLGEIFLLKRLDSSFFGYHRESRRIGRLKSSIGNLWKSRRKAMPMK